MKEKNQKLEEVEMVATIQNMQNLCPLTVVCGAPSPPTVHYSLTLARLKVSSTQQDHSREKQLFRKINYYKQQIITCQEH